MFIKNSTGRMLFLMVLAGLEVFGTSHAEVRRVSVSTAGVQGDALSDTPSLSGDGSVVAFHSTAKNLAANDPNSRNDAYVHWVGTGETLVTSAAADGTIGGATSTRAVVSADGKAVVFQSDADNLVPGDGNTHRDIFLKDLATGAVRIVSLSAAGEQANGHSTLPRFSRDGNRVVFVSEATNLVPNDTNEKNDVFVKNLMSGEIRIASASATGELGNDDSTFPVLSADGNFVAFSSAASNFVKLDTNKSRDIFVKNMTTGEIRRLSVSAAGQQGDTHSDGPNISADGTIVTFSSESRFLVPNDTNGDSDVFLCDLTAGTIRRASVTATGAETNGASYVQSLSDDGKVLAFGSDAPDVVPAPAPNYLFQVYVKDLTTGEVRAVSVGLDGKIGDGPSFAISLSGDGKKVAFHSESANLVAGDTNNKGDIFVADTGLGGTVVPTPTLGDVNADAAIDVQDAILLLQFAVGIKAPTEAQMASGDVKKDGHLTVEDAVAVLQHIVFGTPLG